MITTSIRTTAIALTAIAFVGTAASAAEIDAPEGTGMMSLDYQGTWSASDHTRTSENVHSLWLNGLLGGSGNDLSNQWSFDPMAL